MKKTYKFDFQAQLNDVYHHIAGHANVKGECDYDVDRNDYYDSFYADIRVITILLMSKCKRADGTLAYYIDKQMGGYLSDEIDRQIHEHMRHILYSEDDSHIDPFDENRICDETVDRNLQDEQMNNYTSI